MSSPNLNFMTEKHCYTTALLTRSAGDNHRLNPELFGYTKACCLQLAAVKTLILAALYLSMSRNLTQKHITTS